MRKKMTGLPLPPRPSLISLPFFLNYSPIVLLTLPSLQSLYNYPRSSPRSSRAVGNVPVNSLHTAGTDLNLLLPSIPHFTPVAHWITVYCRHRSFFF